MSRTKKIAIACDTYKLPTFKRELKRLGYTFSVMNGVTIDTKLISVKTTEDKIQEIHAMCERIERHFKQRKP